MTTNQSSQIAEILKRRANEIAMFSGDNRGVPASVELALSREIERLRGLAEAVCPTQEEETG